MSNSSNSQPTSLVDISRGLADDSSSSEEVEPRLKYKRFGNDIPTILQKDAVSSVIFNSKIICMGTFSGLVHVFDHQGNRISIDHLHSHTMAVNQISLDLAGEFVSTCSDDGKAYVYGLYSVDHQLQYTAESSILSVAIDPLYYKLGFNRRFLTGDERLLLHENTFFKSNMRTTVLLESAGSVQNIKWCGRFVACACRDNMRVYDMEERRLVGLVLWDHPEDNQNLEQYPCCLTWKNSTILMVGWMSTFRICRLKKRRSILKESPIYMLSVICITKVNYYICGLCPLDETQLILLAYMKRHDPINGSSESGIAPLHTLQNGGALPPRMYFYQTKDTKYVELYSDTLSLRSYCDYTYHHYHLEWFPGENGFIIACPKDVIVGIIHDDDERIDWLVSHNKFEEAMELAATKKQFLRRNTLLAVGRQYINYLLTQHEYARAGEICAQVLGDDKNLWETEAFKFARAGQLRALSQYLPADPQHKLDGHIYEMVLYECLKREPEKFVNVIQRWSPQLYNVHDVRNAVREFVITCPNVEKMLPQTVDALLTHSKPYEEALDFYIAVKYKGVFEYIQENKLKTKLYGRLNGLMDLDAVQTVNLLLHGEHLNAEQVVTELQCNQYYLYLYLDALNTNFKFEARKYHNELIKLYADFCPAKLLPLLKRSRHYFILKALAFCERRHLYHELVHLLTRVGNTKKALHVLLYKIGDMELATHFCGKYRDFDLWKELIKHFRGNPEFVKYFLPKMDKYYIDPRMLICRLDDTMPIGPLKTPLLDMLDNCKRKTFMEESCEHIFVSDSNNTFMSLVGIQQCGYRVDYDFMCGICNQKVLAERNCGNIVLFHCLHSFHRECFSSVSSSTSPGDIGKCTVCSLSRDRKV